MSEIFCSIRALPVLTRLGSRASGLLHRDESYFQRAGLSRTIGVARGGELRRKVTTSYKLNKRYHQC